MSIRIVTDSTCDLPQETIQKYGIHVVPMYINVGKTGYLDGVDITREQFYQQLPTFPTHPTTAVPSMGRFTAAYQALAEEGATEILSIHISNSLSAVTNVAKSAAGETSSVRVTVIDARQLSMGTGFAVEMAAEMAASGCKKEEILAALEDQIRRTHVFAALDTLEYLKRSGRMNKYLVGFANLLQIKPILTMNDGKIGMERIRTQGRAMNRVVEMLASLGKLERVAIVHTHAHPDRIAGLREKASAWLPAGEILTVDLTPVIGAHIGPGAMGFAAIQAGG